MGWRKLGIKIRSAFLPRLVWGGEIFPGTLENETRIRLVGLRLPRVNSADPGEYAVSERFEGTLSQAEAFARKRGLALAGWHCAFHDPFTRIVVLSVSANNDHADWEALAERHLPLGLKAEQVESRVFTRHDGLVHAFLRRDKLEAMIESLPASLSSLWSLVPAPLALLGALGEVAEPEAWVALMPMPREMHALFFQGGALVALQSLPMRQEMDVPALSVELRKALVHYWEGYRQGLPLLGYALWTPSPSHLEAALPQALGSLGIPAIVSPWNSRLLIASPVWRVATAMALSGTLGRDDQADFGPIAVTQARRHRHVLALAGKWAWVGILAMATLWGSLALLTGMVLVLEKGVAAKSREWAEPLAKWERLQDLRLKVQGDFGGFNGQGGHDGLGGLLTQGNKPGETLVAIANLLPEGIWLEYWEAQAPADSAMHHVLGGYALAEGRIPEVVASLQRSRLFRSVRLRLTEIIPGEKVQQKTGLAANRRDLVRFEIVIEPRSAP